nr:hypothetical protein [Tanacetum cinerariifolium]
PPDVPPTHTSSFTLGPSTAAQDTPVRDPTPVREPTPSLVREPTTFQEPTSEPPRLPSPSPPPCLTRQTSFLEDISEVGGGYVSSPKSNDTSPTIAAIAAGGVSAGSFMDPASQTAAAPSSSAIPAVDKGKAPMVDDSIPVDLLTEQEHVLKNLHDYQLEEDLAKKLQAEQEAEFARQQEELAQKA